MIWQNVKFNFSGKSPIEVSQEIDGYRTEIGLDSDIIIINNIGKVDVVSAEDAVAIAKGIADKFLNKLSWKHNFATEIKKGWSVEYIEPDSAKKRIKVMVCCDTCRTIRTEKSYKIKITEASFDAESYFRRGALSKDCFEKFRNFYLVAENISSFICQKKNVGEIKEQPMLELGLQECVQNKLLDLENQAKELGIVVKQSEIIQDVASYLYKENRCCLNHAKEGEKKKVPFNLKDEESVKKALPLMECVAKSFLAYAEKISAP